MSGRPSDPLALAPRAQGLEASRTLALSAAAKALRAQGKPVIDLTAGEPDFPTPEPIQEAARQAMAQGYTKYSPAGGFADLREALAAKFGRDQGVRLGPDRILVSNGAKHAIHNLVQTVVSPGDRVLIPVPYWLSYPSIARLAGGVPVPIPGRADDPRRIDPEALARAARDGARLLLLNSPSNPSGAVMDRGEIETALAAVEGTGCWILSDEIYEFLVYDGRRHLSPAQVRPDLADRMLLVSGASKSYAMTGWRIGYAAGPKRVIEAATAVQSHSTSGPNSIAQRATLAALALGPEVLDGMRRTFQERRDALVQALKEVPGLRCPLPEGAFFAWAEVGGLLRSCGVADDDALAERWLSEIHVAVMPGSAFGAPGWVRLSYAVGVPALREACRRLATWARQPGKNP